MSIFATKPKHTAQHHSPPWLPRPTSFSHLPNHSYSFTNTKLYQNNPLTHFYFRELKWRHLRRHLRCLPRLFRAQWRRHWQASPPPKPKSFSLDIEAPPNQRLWHHSWILLSLNLKTTTDYLPFFIISSLTVCDHHEQHEHSEKKIITPTQVTMSNQCFSTFSPRLSLSLCLFLPFSLGFSTSSTTTNHSISLIRPCVHSHGLIPLSIPPLTPRFPISPSRRIFVCILYIHQSTLGGNHSNTPPTRARIWCIQGVIGVGSGGSLCRRRSWLKACSSCRFNIEVCVWNSMEEPGVHLQVQDM